VQKEVGKLASGLFYCWCLFHNNNTALNLQTFTSSCSSRRFSACDQGSNCVFFTQNLLLVSDGFAHRSNKPWPRAAQLLPIMTHYLLKISQRHHETSQRHHFTIYFETSENANVKTYQCSNNTMIWLVMQYKNDTTTFHRSSAVSVVFALKSDVTAVLNCKNIDNFVFLKA